MENKEEKQKDERNNISHPKNTHTKYNKENRKRELLILKRDVLILDFLDEMNIKPSKINYNRAWYNSPIRSGDDNPSFCVYTDQNKWWDFGINEGGSIIDLIMKYFNMDYIETIKMLRKRYNNLLNQ